MSIFIPTGEQFYEQIRLVLNNFDDLDWLGSQSPLAAPYFLGDWIAPADLTAARRGEALRQAFVAAADELWGEPLPTSREALEEAVADERRELGNKGQRYAFLLLELRYFRRYFRPLFHPKVNQEADIRDYLGVGRGPYFNHLKAARQALGDALLNLTRPTVRLERPLQNRHPLIGRSQFKQQLLANLAAGAAVALSGPSGVGKTALAAEVAHEWGNTAVFWYTLRPTLNDQIDSLLFALGTFCHQHGASNLWRQLIADGGQIGNRSLALGHLHADLHTLPQPPLLCFDELDSLQRPPEEMTLLQKEWIELLGGLHHHCALLFIGQQRILPADHAYQLSSLQPAETETLLQNIGQPPTPQEVQTLQQYTGGNPRLLQLCRTLLNGGGITELMPQLPEQPILHLIFERLWHKLPAPERSVAQQLSVFANPAPTDSWTSQEQAALTQLADQHIAFLDAAGGVALLPLYRDLIYTDRQRLPAERADTCHLQAAVWRAERAEFTAAAHHLIQAGEVETAVSLWFQARQREIRRGQGPVALPLFAQLSQRRLSAAGGEMLSLIRAELYDLLGQPTAGLRELEAPAWQTSEERQLEANRLKGKLLYETGALDEAVSLYEASFLRVSRLLQEQAHLSHLRGKVYLRERSLGEAWRSGLQAQFHAERLLASVLDEKGEFESAIIHYRAGQAVAEQLNDPANLARVQHDLALVHARQGNHEAALEYAQAARQTYQQLGDRFSQEKLNNFLTALYLNMKAFDQVVAIGEPALRFFEQAKLDYWASMTAANIAEAQYELQNYDLAEQRARQVLALEEAHSYPYALYTMGLIMQARGKLTDTAVWLQQALKVAQQNQDTYLEAYVWRALGHAHAANQQPEAAQQAYGQAVSLFAEMGIEAERVETEALLDDDALES
ncbi:MAG: tetratricopeptide repeat protein [Candidatus Promineifilaceae bacterium]